MRRVILSLLLATTFIFLGCDKQIREAVRPAPADAAHG
jgi:hypothetical protein